MMLLLALGCANDCEQACNDVGRRLKRCLAGWSADWEDLGAQDQSDFQDQCVAAWDEAVSDMEPRELDAALDECASAVQQLRDTSCDELRALYLD